VLVASLVLVLAPLLASCTPTTNNPDEYGITTEANVVDGCVQAQAQAQGITVDQIVIDDNDTADDADDVLVVPENVPDTILDPCRCLYDGIVEDIDFSTFEDIDSTLEDALKDAGESGDSGDSGGEAGGTTTTLVPSAFTELVARCFPST
jgi:hypothetical protein